MAANTNQNFIGWISFIKRIIELKEDVYREGDINVKAKKYYTYKHKKPPYHFDMEASL